MKKHHGSIHLAFSDHKHNARVRGIAFDFTLDEWVAWWEGQLGPDWSKMRGCKKHQYVMARYYDDGPYAAHNVKCLTVTENHLERNRRLWGGRRKLENQAL